MMERTRNASGVETALLALMLASIAVPLNIKIGGVFRVFTFDGALFVLYAAWTVRYRQGADALPRFRVVDVAALLMLVWLAVSAVLGTDPITSFDAVLYYVRMYLIYLYVVNHLRTPAQAEHFVHLLLALIAIEGLVAIIQYATKTSIGSIPDLVGGTVRKLRIAPGAAIGETSLLFRARGTLGYDVPLAHWFELLLPVAVSLWSVSKKRLDRIAYAGVVGLGFVGLILTFARAAWMGLAIAVAVLFLFTWRKFGLDRRYLIGLVAATVTLGLIVVLFWTPIQARLFSQQAVSMSVKWRGLANRTAYEMLSARPLSGVGLDNFAQQAWESETIGPWVRGQTDLKVHNVYLFIASESGFVGLELFLAFLAIAGITLYHVHTNASGFGAAVGRGLLAGFLGVLVHDLFDWGLVSYMVFPLFWALLGLGNALRQWR